MFKSIRASRLKMYIKHLLFIPILSSPTLRILFRKRVDNGVRETDQKDIVRKIVSQYSRGSPCLSKGSYTTKSDIDKRIESLSRYSFVDRKTG